MKPLAEIAPFLAVALAVHAGAFALVAQGGVSAGVSAGGNRGQGQITLEGGDPGLSELVATWERPPELAAPPAPTDMPMSAETLPQLRTSTTPELPSLQAMVRPSLTPDIAPAPAPPVAPRAPVAQMTAPDTSPDLPDLAETTSPLPMPTRPLATGLATAFDRLEPGDEPDRVSPEAQPDTTPPPAMMTAANAPERSPRPRARPHPLPRQEVQVTRATPAPRPTAAPAAAPAQRAAGTGADGHEGQSGQASVTSRAQADTGGLVAHWGGAIRAAVQRQQRHPAGIRAGGTVHLRLDVHSDGRLLAVALSQSSGHAALDQAALDAVRRARLPAAPQGLGGSFQFNLPVRFRG